MIEIFIENQPADVNEGFSSLLSFVIDDVRDFTGRNCSYSKTIILPGTKVNNKLFGSIFQVNRSTQYDSTLPNYGYNFNAAISARAIMFADNIQVFKGVLRLMKIINEKGKYEYEVSLFGELGGFVMKVGSNKLSGNVDADGVPNTAIDLDFSAYDHSYGTTDIEASWDNANGGAGYYYPVADYGAYGRNAALSAAGKHSWVIGTMRPALFVKEYLEKIFTLAGYTWDAPLFETDRFKRLIVPHNRKSLTRKDTDVLAATITTTHVNPSIFSWDAIASTIFALTTSNQHIEYTATPSVSGSLKVSVGGNFKHGDLFVEFYKNGVLILTKTIVWDGFSNPQYFSYTQTLTGQSFGTGDYISCIVGLTGVTTGYDKNITSNTVEFFSDIPQDVQVNFLDTVVMNDTIPRNVLQKDFVSSIVKLYNLYVFEDVNSAKHLKIAPFVDFYSGATVDWSGRMDRGKPISYLPMSELNARYYDFLYKDDADYFNDLYRRRYNQGYGSLRYDSAYEFAKETEKIELIFAATPLVGYAGEDKVYSTIFKLTNGVEEALDSVIRIWEAKKIEGVASWDITDNDGVTVRGTFTNYGYAGHFNDPDVPTADLNFGALSEVFFTLTTGALDINQFNVYWSPYMAEITDPDSKLLTATFKLKRRDIYDLDFSTLIWIDGGLFRLSKIIDYNATAEDTCTVELLKVLNLPYNTAEASPPSPFGYITTEDSDPILTEGGGGLIPE